MANENARKFVEAALEGARSGDYTPEKLEAVNLLVRTAQEAEDAQAVRDHEARMKTLRSEERREKRDHVLKVWAGLAIVVVLLGLVGL